MAADGRPETANNALGLEAEKSAYNGSNRLQQPNGYTWVGEAYR